MKRFLLLASAMLVAVSVSAITPNKIVIPDVEGYKMLKGDFHIHTVFSDATVWPAHRVYEAKWEGLDVIAISDHIDSRHQKMRNTGYFTNKSDRNEGARIAAAVAGDEVLVVPAGEITRGMPPGHFNTLFVKDNEAICKAAEANDQDHVLAMTGGLKEARKQGAFLMWNHPHWHKHAPNETKIYPAHKQYIKSGLLDAIEIYNMACGYSPEAHEWCLKHNLAMLGNSDCHQAMINSIDYLHGEHRPVTLVFAKERTLEGVREALDARRTAVFAEGMVYGREKELEPLFKACVKIKSVKMNDKMITFTIENKSSIPIVLRKAPGSEGLYFPQVIEVAPFSSKSFKARQVLVNHKSPDFSANVRSVPIYFYVENFQVGANKPLKFTVKATR